MPTQVDRDGLGDDVRMNAPRIESGSTAPELVASLIDAGIIAPEDRARALALVSERLPTSTSEAAGPTSTLIATLAGYVGGILVLAAGGVFLSLRWGQLSLASRVLALAGAGAILATVAAVVRRGGQAAGTDDTPRQRLAGVLGIGAAALAAGAVGTWLDARLDPSSQAVPSIAFAVFTLLAVTAYLFSPTLPGQLAIAWGVVVTTFTTTDLALERSALPAGLVLLAIGLLWLALAERGTWREDQTARLVGGAIALIGAQAPAFESSDTGIRALAYVLLFLLWQRRLHWLADLLMCVMFCEEMAVAKYLVIVASVFLILACNTVEGVGKDIKKAGNAIEKAAQ